MGQLFKNRAASVILADADISKGKDVLRVCCIEFACPGTKTREDDGQEGVAGRRDFNERQRRWASDYGYVASTALSDDASMAALSVDGIECYVRTSTFVPSKTWVRKIHVRPSRELTAETPGFIKDGACFGVRFRRNGDIVVSLNVIAYLLL